MNTLSLSLSIYLSIYLSMRFLQTDKNLNSTQKTRTRDSYFQKGFSKLDFLKAVYQLP